MGFVNEPRPEITPPERRDTTDPGWTAHLAALVDRDAGPAARLISEGELELAGDNTYDLGHVPRWRRDRMVVIGDAAHAPWPSSGQGASMAMEDGVVLAQCLRDGAGVPSSLAAYEATRRRGRSGSSPRVRAAAAPRRRRPSSGR